MRQRMWMFWDRARTWTYWHTAARLPVIRRVHQLGAQVDELTAELAEDRSDMHQVLGRVETALTEVLRQLRDEPPPVKPRHLHVAGSDRT